MRWQRPTASQDRRVGCPRLVCGGSTNPPRQGAGVCAPPWPRQRRSLTSYAVKRPADAAVRDPVARRVRKYVVIGASMTRCTTKATAITSPMARPERAAKAAGRAELAPRQPEGREHDAMGHEQGIGGFAQGRPAKCPNAHRPSALEENRTRKQQCRRHAIEDQARHRPGQIPDHSSDRQGQRSAGPPRSQPASGSLH